MGALVQANYGSRDLLRIDGVPIGTEIPVERVSSPWADLLAGQRATAGGGPRRDSGAGAGSIIVVLATDAPLLPHQCERLAQRAGLGIARMGGIGSNTSGDIFIAFATGNRGLPEPEVEPSPARVRAVRMLDDGRMSDLFLAAIEATEEAIVNALLVSETMTGVDGLTAHGLDGDQVVEIMGRYGRGPRAHRTDG